MTARPAALVLTAVVMAAFAANSVLARLALTTTAVDAATFTGVRVLAGALALGGLVAWRRERMGGSWRSAAALVVYAGCFSVAYLQLPTGAGALVLFGAVQLTMIGRGVAEGERPSAAVWLGVALAFGGLVALVAPGLTAPPLVPALVMAASGVGWGVYSLRGRGSQSPTADTAGNFLRAVPIAAAAAAGWWLATGGPSADAPGLAYAAVSGAVTSGLGYALWYRVLPALRAATAATVQLSVPVLAAVGGLALGEPVTVRLALAGAVTLGGIALVVRGQRGKRHGARGQGRAARGRG